MVFAYGNCYLSFHLVVQQEISFAKSTKYQEKFTKYIDHYALTHLYTTFCIFFPIT